jgi:phosphoserine phosphatase
MSLLHVFDMDGTLLRGTTASLEMARRLGCEPQLLELEESFARGAIDTRAFSLAAATLYGPLTDEIVAEIFRASPWIPGLPEVLGDIRARGEHSLVITMSPDFYAGGLRELGADEVVASRFPPLPIRVMPDPVGILTPEDKVTIVNRVLVGHGLSTRQCLAYGDSGSDIPLFRHLPTTVAVNAGAELAALATVSYEGEDLREAYELARAQLPGSGSHPHRLRGQP